MDTTEICPLTQEAIVNLLTDREPRRLDATPVGRRKAARWPFPGTVELWIPDEAGLEQYCLATSLNLSVYGVGIRCDEALSPGLELAIAIHEPEASLHGKAVVRHCTEMGDEYLAGLQFLFDAA